MQCEYYALEGLSDLQSTIRLVSESLNPGLDIEGIVLCMVDPRQNLTQQVTSEVRAHFDGKVYDTTVPRNVRLSEAPSFGKPILLYDVASKGARSYLDLAREFLARAAGRARGRGGRAMSAPKRKALGRGLAALIPGAPSPVLAGGRPAIAAPARERRRRDAHDRDRGRAPVARAAAQDLRRRARWRSWRRRSGRRGSSSR